MVECEEAMNTSQPLKIAGHRAYKKPARSSSSVSCGQDFQSRSNGGGFTHGCYLKCISKKLFPTFGTLQLLTIILTVFYFPSPLESLTSRYKSLMASELAYL